MTQYYFIVFAPERQDAVLLIVPGLGSPRQTSDGRLISSHNNSPLSWRQETDLLELGCELVPDDDIARRAQLLPLEQNEGV